MKWVKILLISSLAIFQLSACSLNSEDGGLSVTRMENGNRGLPTPQQDIPNMDIGNLLSGDWGRFYSQGMQQTFQQAIAYMLQTSPQPVQMGYVSNLLDSPDKTGVAFKGRLGTNSSLSLTSNPQAYLDSLKTDPSKIQVYIGVWDSWVGQWNDGGSVVNIEPFSFYYGASNSGVKGQVAFNYQANGNNVDYVIFLADQFGEMRLDGTLLSGTVTGSYTDGVVRYKSRWNNSADYVVIGNYRIGTCHLFKCS